MVKTVFVGESFLLHSVVFEGDYQYCFYGANRITSSIWQVNFSHHAPKICESSFCLNLEAGNFLHIPNSIVFILKDGSVVMRFCNDKTKISSVVASIKIVEIGQDFLTLEYELAE